MAVVEKYQAKNFRTTGGALSKNVIPNNTAQNIWDHVSETDRTTGGSWIRKIFFKKLSGTVASAKAFIQKLSTAGDYIRLMLGTDADVLTTAEDYGWEEESITWNAGTRKVTTTTEYSLAVGYEVWFFQAGGTATGGDYRGKAIIDSIIDTQNFTIDTMEDGDDPVTGDTCKTLWYGSGEITEALTAATSTTVVAMFDTNDGVFPEVLLGLVDWDNLDANDRPTIEYLDVSKAVFTIGTGDIHDDDCSDLTDWTDEDNNGASTQETYDGRETFKFTVAAHGAGNKAQRKQDVGTISDDGFTLEFRIYNDEIGALADSDYFLVSVDNGAILFTMKIASNGVYIYDGAADNQVGTDIEQHDEWTVYKVIVDSSTPATATCDVYVDGTLAASGEDCSDLNTATDGEVILAQHGVTTDNVLSYSDFLKISDDEASESGECYILCDSAVTSNHAVKTRGEVQGSQSENFDVDGETLIIKINGGSAQTITFSGDGKTAAQVVDAINTDLTGGTAYVYDTDKVAIYTDDYYSDNSIQVTADSTADTTLGLDNTINSGTDGTVAAAMVELGTIEASCTTPVKTSALGTFTGVPTVYDVGTVTDDFTITFTSATEFTVAGTLSGALTSGDINTDYSPANGDFGSYYFTIESTAWGGTWAAADTLTFSTVNSAKAVQAKEVVPASTAADSDNVTKIGFRGQE